MTIVQVGVSTDVSWIDISPNNGADRKTQLHYKFSVHHSLPPYKMAKLPVFPPSDREVAMQHWRTALGQLLSESLCTDMTPHAEQQELRKVQQLSEVQQEAAKKNSKVQILSMQKYFTYKCNLNKVFLVENPNLNLRLVCMKSSASCKYFTCFRLSSSLCAQCC